jgi:hypothetical protein
VKQAPAVFIGQIAMATPRDTTAAALIDGLSVAFSWCLRTLVRSTPYCLGIFIRAMLSDQSIESRSLET